MPLSNLLNLLPNLGPLLVELRDAQAKVAAALTEAQADGKIDTGEVLGLVRLVVVEGIDCIQAALGLPVDQEIAIADPLAIPEPPEVA